MVLRSLFVAVAATLALPALAQERVVIATTGGAYEKALKEAWFDPFTRETGIPVVPVAATGGEMRARAKAMVRSGAVQWDLYFEGEIQAGSAEHAEVAEDLSAFCADFAGRPDLLDNSCSRAGALIALGTTLMVWDRTALGGREPKTWADMWDTAAFPGGRALPSFGDPWRVLAAALLADGVPADRLFPLDVDRAFRKLEAIRPAVTLWWKTGDQSTQGFRNKDYAIGQIWLTRAQTLKTEGRDIGWSYEGAFLVGDRASLLKGAPNRTGALRMLRFYLEHPEVQAKLCEAVTCTPPSRAAVSLMSPVAQAAMPGSPEVMRRIVLPDAAWINANQAQLVARWNAWIR